ncbi:hypothetical protein OAH04_01465 [Crocinitomicaceae bacterium]|nr:hypothetical protein [Crocinitomicaceae bacterium]
MNKIFSYTGLLILVLNSLIGLMLSGYAPFNWILNDVVIFVNILLFNILAASKVKDGYKIGLTFVFTVFGSIEFLLGVFMNNYFINNLFLILLSIVFMIHIGLLIVVSSLNKFA